jgi:hypothetical protein
MFTKAKKHQTQMKHIIIHALKTRDLGYIDDLQEVNYLETDCISIKIYDRGYNITYWKIGSGYGGTEYVYVVDDGVSWINDERRRRR